MKWSFLLFSSFLCLQAIAQYPATGNKMRLGWQTTGDGLVYRGAIGDTATLDPSGINNAWMLLDTANGNLYAYRAKAWRLVSGGGGGGGVTMPFDSVTFNVNETDASLRELKYSEEKGYLQYGGQDSVQIPLLPGIWYVRNDTSVTIPKGTVVRATGTLGASGRIKVKHMIANGTIDAMYVLGIAMQDIAVGADGYVMTQGKIRNVNTQAYSEGAVLYADVDTLGGLTQTEPTGSNLKLPIAFVVHSASNGTLAVRVSPGTYLRDLHDAYITSPVSNASLYYNTSESVWRDTTPAALKSDISGTTNYLAKFTGSNAVGNSVIQDNGTNVGISASPSSFKLDINGSTHTTGDFYADRAARSASAGFVSAQTNNRWLAGMISNSGSWHVYDLLRSTSVMTLDSATGNVGIATSSPFRPLHVNANSSMIIPSGATGTRPASGASGDIRYNTTNANFEWHTGTAWREPVNAARSPNTVDLANRFSKFNADGLLDTSAVLVQANGRIGIWNSSPAASDSVLTVTGGIRATTGVMATRFNVNTFSTQLLSINNFAPTGASGQNVWIGNGGQSSSYTSGANGSFNISLGGGALLKNTTGAYNSALGSRVLENNTTGISNIGIGALALLNNVSGGDNIAIGASSLQDNLADKNIAIGGAALRLNTTGTWNFAFGLQAAYSNTTGNFNMAYGAFSMYFNQTGSENIAIGYNALRGGSTLYSANSNISIGYESMFSHNTGNNNVSIGTFAGRYNTSGVALDSTANSVFIGYDTRAAGDNQTNQVVIGYQAIGNGSNTTTIGNSSTTNTVIPAGSLTVDVMRRKAPVTVTGNHTVAASTSWLICDATGTILLTLPTASSWTGREIMVKTIQPQAVNSAANNVVPIDGVAAGAGILPATDGAWCTLVSDGTNWIIMQRGN